MLANRVEVCQASINWDDEAEEWVLVIMWIAVDGDHVGVTTVGLPDVGD